MVVEILTSEDEHFGNATCNNIEKLGRQIIVILKQNSLRVVYQLT